MPSFMASTSSTSAERSTTSRFRITPSPAPPRRQTRRVGIRLIGFGSATTIANITKATIDREQVTNFPSGSGIQVQGGNGNLAGRQPGSSGHVGSADGRHHASRQQRRPGKRGKRIGTFGIVGNVNGRGQAISNGDRRQHAVIRSQHHWHFDYGRVLRICQHFACHRQHHRREQRGRRTGHRRRHERDRDPGYRDADADGAHRAQRHQQHRRNGILVTARDASGTVNARIIDNTVDAPLSGNRNGIRVDSGNGLSGDETCESGISRQHQRRQRPCPGRHRSA